jgi:hypothetical protein
MIRWVTTLISVVVGLGCATQVVVPTPTPIATAPSPTPAATDRPRGAMDVVLRMSVGGGLRYPGATVELPPYFTLYGDGRVIYLRWTTKGTETSVEIQMARATDEQIDQLLVGALDDGGLATASGHYSEGPFADDVTTTFQIHAAGIDKSVSVYGLGHEEEGVPDLAIRRQMAELKTRLGSFDTDVAAGRVEDLGGFEPEWYRVTLDHPWPELEATTREWPWHDLEPDDFRSDLNGFPVHSLTEEQAALIAEPPMSAPDDVVMRGPNGIEYLIRLVALLPDQVP